MVTIYDLAKITGFSVATVTRTLNGTGSIGDDAKDRILKAAELTGYKAPVSPEKLNGSRLIGVIVEEESFQNGLEHPLFGGILNCLREQAKKNDYNIIYLSKRVNSHISYLDYCKMRNIEGIMILNSDTDDPEINELVANGIPCVSSNEFIPGVCTVVSENTIGAKTAVDYLINKGHRKIGYIGGPFQIRSPASIERCEGYKQALKAAGIRFDADRIEKAVHWDYDSGIDAAKNLFERCPDLTAVFCACDTIAAGAITYLQKQGREVPEDVSIVGFDDSLISVCCMPSITTFRQDREKIAITCCTRLLEAMDGKKHYEIVRVPVEFLERESVKEIPVVETEA